MAKLKEKILDTAYRQFESGGYGSVTMRSLAVEIGVTHPAIYTYFKSKDEIFAALKTEIFRKLKDNLFKDINPHDTFKNIVQKITNNFITFIDSKQPYFKILFLLDGNVETNAVQLQIIEYIDELLMLPADNLNLSQMIWYSLIGHSYARYSGEINRKRQLELMYELVERLSNSQ